MLEHFRNLPIHSGILGSRFCYTSYNGLGHAFWGIKATPYSPARFNDGFAILPFSPYGFKMKTLTLGLVNFGGIG